MSPFQLGSRFIGEITELPGAGQDHPFIQWCLSLTGLGFNAEDSVPWCSAYLNAICWLLRLPRSKSARARSWLLVGQAIQLPQAIVGYDVVILKRGEGNQPNAEILDAPGHVGFYAGQEGASVLVLGGNQGNGVSVLKFPITRILGIRRLQG